MFRPAKWELCPEFDVGENIEEVELEDGRNGDEDFFRLVRACRLDLARCES